MGKIIIDKIMDDVYRLNDNNETNGFVVVGKDRALLIDTMYGREDIKKLVETITKLPLMVVNSHGHPDHIAGNFYFEEIYIHPDDMPLAKMYMEGMQKSFLKEIIPADRKLPKLLPLKEGDTIDLGDQVLDVYKIPGHTKGSICLLDHKHRILFTGDGANPHIWMQLDESLSLPELIPSLEFIESISDEFDMILTGHCAKPENIQMVHDLKRGVQEVIDGQTQDDEPYEYLGRVATAHCYDKNNLDKKVVYKK